MKKILVIAIIYLLGSFAAAAQTVKVNGTVILQVPRGTEPLHGLWRCFSAGRRRAFRRRVRFGYLCPRVEKAQTRAWLRPVVSARARDLPPLERRAGNAAAKDEGQRRAVVAFVP